MEYISANTNLDTNLIVQGKNIYFLLFTSILMLMT
jgi:hypothetical protein